MLKRLPVFVAGFSAGWIVRAIWRGAGVMPVAASPAPVTPLPVRPACSEDERLAARVEGVVERLTLRPVAVRVRAKDGRVTLEGEVSHPELKGLLHAVAKVRGVTAVENRLNRHGALGDLGRLRQSEEHGA